MTGKHLSVFVTGASGYIGGSVAMRLLKQGHRVLGLVRSREKAELLQLAGIEPLVGGLDDVDVLQAGALETDATINAANSDHLLAVQTLVEALAGSGKTLIHTSGSSIVCDDAQGATASSLIFDDDAPFVLMDHRVARDAIDRQVRMAGITRGMRTMVVCPTMVYGKGLGLAPESEQIPKLMRQSKWAGAGVYIGAGLPIWSNVFIGDLADLYVAALTAAPSASFYFAENGEAAFQHIAESIALALGFGSRTTSWAYTEAITELGNFARVALATNARVRATNARAVLGWRPSGPSLHDALLNAA